MSSPPRKAEADLPGEGPPATEETVPVNPTEAAEEALRIFAEEADLDLALIVDPGGPLVAGITSDPGISTEGMGSLISDSASMAKTLSEQLGDGGTIESFHQTRDFSLYVRELENRLLLVGRGKADAPAGLVREVAARSGRELAETLSSLEVGEFPAPPPRDEPQAIVFPPPIEAAGPENDTEEAPTPPAQESATPPSLAEPESPEEDPLPSLPDPPSPETSGVALSELPNLTPYSPESRGPIARREEGGAPHPAEEEAPATAPDQESTPPPANATEPIPPEISTDAGTATETEPVPVPPPFSQGSAGTEASAEPEHPPAPVEPALAAAQPAPEPESTPPEPAPDPAPPVLVSPDVVDSPFEAVDDEAEEETESPEPSILDESAPRKPGPRYSFDLG